jgi:hypothetical protein
VFDVSTMAPKPEVLSKSVTPEIVVAAPSNFHCMGMLVLILYGRMRTLLINRNNLLFVHNNKPMALRTESISRSALK